jgi:hypothetical protein
MQLGWFHQRPPFLPRRRPARRAVRARQLRCGAAAGSVPQPPAPKQPSPAARWQVKATVVTAACLAAVQAALQLLVLPLLNRHLLPWLCGQAQEAALREVGWAVQSKAPRGRKWGEEAGR